MIREKSNSLYKTALQYFPGGVNSPVRAFRAVGGSPIFIDRGEGCKIWDADGNEYIDFCCSWGPLILGHNHHAVKKRVALAMEKGVSFGVPTRLENDLAGLILANNKVIEKIRFVSSGTEAVMSAIRLARGFTKRDKIIKFDGCYHGHSDSLLVKAGSGLATFGVSSSAGVTEAVAHDTIVLDLSDREAVEKAFENHEGEIACIIIEPVPANNGLLIQSREYLEFLRTLCTKNGALLIFDEVISGFRIGFQGAAAYYGIKPDLVTYGKIIGGGFPVGAYGGKANIMKMISPDGEVYQAGTLSGNPVAMAAGIAQLGECLREGFYEDLALKTGRFAGAVNGHAQKKDYEAKMFFIGSIFWLAFIGRDNIQKASEIDPAGMEKFKLLHSGLLDRGVYLGPSGYEVGFVSQAHSEGDLKAASDAICNTMDNFLG